MREKISVVIFCIVAVVFHTTSALAGDAKIYPGTQCKEIEPNTVYYTWGAALNKTYRTISVTCPIARDAGGIARGWISFIDQIHNDTPDPADGIKDIACYLALHRYIYTL